MDVRVLVSLLCIVACSVASAKPVKHGKRRRAERPMESRYYFEGDIVLPGNVTDRNAISRDVKKWTDGVVPFVIESSLGKYVRSIRAAMREIEKKTCIRFVRRTNQPNYISLYYGQGCYSTVGRGLSPGPQPVSIGDGCIFHGTILHELLHAIGFYHEHSRSDRDDYIEILLHNVDEENLDQFDKLHPSQNRLLSPFDYESVMLYGSNAFAKSPRVFTMLKKGGGRLTEVFHKSSLSDSDVARIRTLYKC